tara:strand:+ start:349 stop:1995 length:1647 start_codon:yes stop_codon:yes gene_type:complete
MPKKKIAIIGAGNAGCITALHFYFHGRNEFEIELYHSPEKHPIERVGQGTTLRVAILISSVFGSNWYDNNIGATLKSGILYEGWGKAKDEFFHSFPMSSVAVHYVPQMLSDAVLKSGLFKVKQQTINDPEKEIDSDWIIDCRGRHNRDKDNYDSLINPLNACLLCRKEGRDNDLIYTRTIATPNGWTFAVPNTDSVSYGYLYNNNITSKEVATEDFLERFNLPEIDGDLTFENYIAKSIFVGERTFLNGNKCSFLEPLEATATGFYQKVCRNIWDYMYGVVSKEVANQNVRTSMFEIEKFILWHYQFGSKYDTPFWKYAKSLPFNPDDKFNDYVETSKKMSRIDMENKWQEASWLSLSETGYGQWDSLSFRCWIDGTKVEKKEKKKELCRKGIFVLDDVLSDIQFKDFDLGLRKFNIINDSRVRQLNTWEEMEFAHHILKNVEIKSHYMYEVWQHIGTTPYGWHVDKDEILHEQGILDCPLFGLIYYPSVQSDLRGGNLIFKDGMTIVPKTNRLVIHSPGSLWHCVEEYVGYRHSININIWDKKKLGE